MKLLNLEIRNFKKIKQFDMQTYGKNVRILGQNGTGKTTIFDAYSWVVTGKSSRGNAIEGQIKAFDDYGNQVIDGGKEHSVALELQKDDGSVITLKKVFAEKHTKKRGQAEAEFTGHTTNYYVNGVPAKKSEYDAYTKEIAGDNFQLLSRPLYFVSEMPWEERRKILMDICGEITPDEIFAANEKLGGLKKALASYSIDDYRKILIAKRKEINAELNKIPARIDELQRIVDAAEPDGRTKEMLQIEIDSLVSQQNDLRNQLVGMSNGATITAKKKEITGIETKILSRKNELSIDYDNKTAANKRKAADLSQEKSQLRRGIDELSARVRVLERSIEQADQRRDKLRQAFYDIAGKTFEPTISQMCPTCGQALPAEKYQAALDKAQADFNLNIANQKAKINEEGKQIKAGQDKDRAALEEFNADIASKTAKLAEVDAAHKQINELLNDVPKLNLDADAELQRLAASKKLLTEQLIEIQDNFAGAAKKIESEIKLLDTDIAARNTQIAAIEQLENTKQRIDELKTREEELGKAFGDNEQQIFLTEEFIRTQIKFIDAKINSKFRYVKFKLFDNAINGGLKECCEPMIDGVPFADGLNKGSQMKAALDVLDTLSTYYGLNLPVFVDDCESYTSMIDINSQLIKLTADRNYPELKIEVEE